MEPFPEGTRSSKERLQGEKLHREVLCLDKNLLRTPEDKELMKLAIDLPTVQPQPNVRDLPCILAFEEPSSFEKCIL